MLVRLAANAAANIANGVGTAAYQFGITAIAGRLWQGANFSSWALAMSIAAMSPLFSANLAGVVTRRLLSARHGSSSSPEGDIVQAAHRLARQLTFGCWLALFALGMLVQRHSAAVTTSPGSFAALLALLLTSQVWVIWQQPHYGQHFANESNWPPTLSMTLTRLISLLTMAAGVWLIADDTLVAAGSLAAGAGAGLVLTRRWRPRLPPSAAGIELQHLASLRAAYQGNLRVFGGFAIWSAGSLVILYGVPSFISIIAPDRFNAFYLASSLNLIVMGAFSAAMSALLAPLTRWHARGTSDVLKRVAYLSPIVSSAAGLIVFSLLWLVLDSVIALWTSSTSSAATVRPFLMLLGFQTLVRISAIGFSLQQASSVGAVRMAMPVLLEILLALTLVLPVGIRFGAEATLVGLALVGSASALYTGFLSVASLADRHGRRNVLLALVATQIVTAGLWWSLCELTR